MPERLHIRAAAAGECLALTDLCMRAKAHWGYDHDFMEAVRAELTVTADDLSGGLCAVADHGGRTAGFVQISTDGAEACLERLFIEPALFGAGIGRALFDWAADRARALGCKRMEIESDPQAAGFYEKMGAKRDGFAPSGSIEGRSLPRLVLTL